MYEVQAYDAGQPSLPFETDWRLVAACRDQGDLFFPDSPQDDRINQAKRICAGCNVAAACLAYAVEVGEPYGIWGGQTAEERGIDTSDHYDTATNESKLLASTMVRLLDDPLSLERTLALTFPSAHSILKGIMPEDMASWDAEPRIDGQALVQLAQRQLDQAYATLDPKRVQRSVANISETAEALMDERFDYAAFVNMHPANCQKNCLTLLIKLGETVPDDMPMSEIRVLALEKSQQLPVSRQRRNQKQLIRAVQDIFGLHSSEPGDYEAIAASVGLTRIQMQSFLEKTLYRYRRTRSTATIAS